MLLGLMVAVHVHFRAMSSFVPDLGANRTFPTSFFVVLGGGENFPSAPAAVPESSSGMDRTLFQVTRARPSSAST